MGICCSNEHGLETPRSKSQTIIAMRHTQAEEDAREEPPIEEDMLENFLNTLEKTEGPLDPDPIDSDDEDGGVTNLKQGGKAKSRYEIRLELYKKMSRAESTTAQKHYYTFKEQMKFKTISKLQDHYEVHG